MTIADQIPQFLDINLIAERLSVTVRQVRCLVTEIRIPFIKWEHLHRLDPVEIEGRIGRQHVTPVADLPTSGDVRGPR